MRILYLMDQMHLHGGVERILSQKVNYLISHFNYDVYLLTTGQQQKPSVYDLNPKLNRSDLDINYNYRKSYFHPENLRSASIHFIRLRNAIAQIRPDLIVSVSISPDQYFLPYLYKSVPKIKEFHASRENYKANTFAKEKLDKIFDKYDALVVLNADEQKHYSNKNIVVIPNFTDFPHNNASVIKEKTVLAAGRIAPVKQFGQLISIWKSIAVKFPEWKLKIFGDGEPNTIESLKTLIKKLDLQANILLLPSVTNIDEEMRKASIYAMTSATECFPMVLLEAQASGLPVISYDCPNGPRHIINNNEDGFLIANGNAATFEKKLSELMQDDSLRSEFSANSRANVSRFSKEKIMMQWNDLFIKTIQ